MPNFTNPKIDGSRASVTNLIDGLSRSATSIEVVGTIPIRPFTGLRYHFQGIAPYNGSVAPTLGNGAICASSDMGYFAVFGQASGSQQAAVVDVVVPSNTYFHTGGFQMLGGLLPVAIESSNSNENGLVVFYDVGRNPSNYLYTLGTPSKKSSASAITTYTGTRTIGTTTTPVEYALLFVYEYDHQEMYVYRALASDIGGDSPDVWTRVTTYDGDAYRTGDQYQNFALVTQTGTSGDTVYLLGFREDEEVWLWTIDVATSDDSMFGDPTFVKKYTGWNGSDWANGVGLQIPDSTSLRLYGTDKDPSGTTSNYSFKIYLYS